MRFDEKPKRRILHLGKSHAELSRGPDSASSQKSATFLKSPQKATGDFGTAAFDTSAFESSFGSGISDYVDTPVLRREKPEKLPEGYDEEEPLLDSLNSAIKNRAWIVVCAVVLLVALGFFTGTFQNLFHHEDTTATTATAEESTSKPKTIFTQGKFDLNFENTDAGVDIICETTTSEDGVEKKICRAKTEEDRKKEQEEKEREEQEKKAKEEREKEEKEDKEAEINKRIASAAAASSAAKSSSSSRTETVVRTTGITSISGCPAEAVSGSIVVLKASALPATAANQNIIWSATKSASVLYDGVGNTATVSVYEGERVIITAMTVDGGYSEHCSFPIVSSLTQ